MVAALWTTVLTAEGHTLDCVLSGCQNLVIAVSRPVTSMILPYFTLIFMWKPPQYLVP